MHGNLRKRHLMNPVKGSADGWRRWWCAGVQVRMQAVQRWTPLAAPPPPPPPMQAAELPPPSSPRKQLQPPVIVTHPADLQILQGQIAEFCVHARVRTNHSAPHPPPPPVPHIHQSTEWEPRLHVCH